jgi:hypothetical protein
VAHTASTEAPARSADHSHESPLHESSNINLRALIWFVVIFVVSAILIHGVIYGIFAGFRQAVAQEREITGVSADHIPPPEPRLQPSVEHNQLPTLDLARMHEAEYAEFARRGWVDPQTHEIRVSPQIVEKLAEMSRPKK